MTEDELQKCNKISSQYVCEQSRPIYRINSDAPCEVQMYTRQRYQQNCNVRHHVSSHMIWIALQRPHTWLYSTAAEQTIMIQCDEQSEKITIKNTGKITLRGECKLATTDMTIQTKKTIYITDTETYLPKSNITFSHNNTLVHDKDTLEDISQHHTELTELKANLKNIENDLRDNEQNFFTQKQFIYPMASSGFITLIIVAIVIWIIIRRKHKNRTIRRPSVSFLEDDFSIPRSILRRSQSTRY